MKTRVPSAWQSVTLPLKVLATFVVSTQLNIYVFVFERCWKINSWNIWKAAFLLASYWTLIMWMKVVDVSVICCGCTHQVKFTLGVVFVTFLNSCTRVTVVLLKFSRVYKMMVIIDIPRTWRRRQCHPSPAHTWDEFSQREMKISISAKIFRISVTAAVGPEERHLDSIWVHICFLWLVSHKAVPKIEAFEYRWEIQNIYTNLMRWRVKFWWFTFSSQLTNDNAAKIRWPNRKLSFRLSFPKSYSNLSAEAVWSNLNSQLNKSSYNTRRLLHLHYRLRKVVVITETLNLILKQVSTILRLLFAKPGYKPQ